jgi:hypothetical protein
MMPLKVTKINPPLTSVFKIFSSIKKVKSEETTTKLSSVFDRCRGFISTLAN